MAGAFITIGNELLGDALVSSVTVRQQLNRHWECEVVCRNTLDRRIPGEEALGAALVVKHTGEDGSEVITFAGVVIDVALKYEIWGSYGCVLKARSSSWLIDHAPRFAHFGTSSLAIMAQQLTSDAGGASSLLAEKTSPAEYVQYGETNWQFLLRVTDDHGGWVRAGLNGIELLNQFDNAIPLVFRAHDGLMEFSIAGDLRPVRVAAAQYDSAANLSSVLPEVSGSATLSGPGQKMGTATTGGAGSQQLLGWVSRSRNWTITDMQLDAQNEAERGSGTAVTAAGVSRCQNLVAGGSVSLSNLGEADGTWYLTAVTHEWNHKEYTNHFEATAWSSWRDPVRPETAIAPGVQVGRVVSNVDPQQRGRLVVSLYWQNGASLLLAPMASLHSGAGFGLTIMPEAGDEVLVGFLDGDPERPAILGSLWNGVHQPPRQQFATGGESEDNLVKRLVTRSGIRIHITDTPGKQSISLATPRSNNLLLSERVTETDRPVLALHTLGDIHLRATGRIHEKAALRSHHVDGKIMHAISIRLSNQNGLSGAYLNEHLAGTLTDGSQYGNAIADGQHFPSIPTGTCQFHFPKFLDFGPGDPPEGVQLT